MDREIAGAADEADESVGAVVFCAAENRRLPLQTQVAVMTIIEHNDEGRPRPEPPL
jgi:hypothetical protein